MTTFVSHAHLLKRIKIVGFLKSPAREREGGRKEEEGGKRRRKREKLAFRKFKYSKPTKNVI